MKILTLSLFGGGIVATAVGGVLALRKSAATKAIIAEAVQAPAPPTPSGGPAPDAVVQLHTTGYWPFTAKDAEKKMEGGVEGAAAWRGRRLIDPKTGKRPYLYTLEQHLSDPIKYPYVSLSGDPDVWPAGQRLTIDAWPNAICRVVDTGGHFRGAGKVYRVVGREPIDVCVDSSKTKVTSNTSARVVRGDNWDGGLLVASKLPAVMGVAPLVDCEARGRAFARAAAPMHGLDLLGVR